MDELRIDKWLWAARFFKTRSIAQEEVSLGRVLLNGQRAKPSRDVKPGDRLEIHRSGEVFHVYVEALSNPRGPAEAAQKLYRETPESLAARMEAKERRKVAFEPADAIRQGRPTKREGRKLRAWQDQWS